MTKFCPLAKYPCKERECAFWYEDDTCCAIVKIAMAVRNIDEEGMVFIDEV